MSGLISISAWMPIHVLRILPSLARLPLATYADFHYYIFLFQLFPNISNETIQTKPQTLIHPLVNNILYHLNKISNRKKPKNKIKKINKIDGRVNDTT